MQNQFSITPYIKLENPCSWVNQVYYKSGDIDILFFSNYSLHRSFSSMAIFSANGKTAWLWDTAKGERYRYPVDGETFNISLEPGESKVIVFGNNDRGETFLLIEPDEANAIVVAGPWKIRLEHVDGTTQNIVMDELVDFKEHEILKSFAGVAYYENTVSTDSATKSKFIDLGKVHGVSELVVNGKEAGSRWYGRHTFDVSKAIHNGENSIQIKITTTLGNYLKSLPDNKDSKKWMKNQPLYSNGLTGPVRMM